MIKVLVITALPEELEAVLNLKANGRADWKQAQTSDKYFYFETDFAAENGNSFRILASAQPCPGMTHASGHTTRMLRYAPDLAFMTGFCAGNEEKGIKLGDAVVSTMAFHYESGKQTGSEFKPDMACANVDAWVLQWLGDFHATQKGIVRFDEKDLKMWVGAFATGSAVIAKLDSFRDLEKRQRSVLALDMEAFAFLQSVEGNNRNIPGIVIKGVCDFADENKGDSFHVPAAGVAARCMLDFATYAIPRMKKNKLPKQTEVIYPISLPRPAQTYIDRIQWKAVLQWQDDDKDFVEERFREQDSSGLEFYELGNEKFLLEISLGFGAYQGSYCYFLLDETEELPSWEILDFRKLSVDYTDKGVEVSEYTDADVFGLPWFDEETNVLKVFTKGRGIGDCGHLASYRIEQNCTSLLEWRDQDLPEYKEDDEIEASEPESWPLIDILVVYPPYEVPLENE